MKKILVCTTVRLLVCLLRLCGLAGAARGAALEVLYVSDLRLFEVPMVADLSAVSGAAYQALLGQLQEFEQERAKAILEQARAHFVAKAPGRP